MPAARCILPLELKFFHQLSLRGQYADLGNVARSSCGGDQIMGNNHSRKRRFPVLLKHVEYKSHQGMRYPLWIMTPETKRQVNPHRVAATPVSLSGSLGSSAFDYKHFHIPEAACSHNALWIRLIRLSKTLSHNAIPFHFALAPSAFYCRIDLDSISTCSGFYCFEL